MTITAVRYTDEAHTMVEVTDSSIGIWVQLWPSRTWRDAQVQDWINAGNQIAMYDPQHGWTLEQVKVAKIREGEEYGRELVQQAHANPYDEVNVADTETYREKVQSKRRLRSDKQALAKPLEPDEEIQLERDEVLQEYEVLCIECSDEFNELVDAAGTPEQVNALNPATDITWPAWTPPA